MEISRDTDVTRCPAVKYTTVTGCRTSAMVRGYAIGPMAMYMRGNGKTICLMVRGL